MTQQIIESKIINTAQILLNGFEDSFKLNSHGLGGNNRGFRLECSKGKFFIKAYFQDAKNQLNRGAREAKFSSFLTSKGITNIPKFVGYDDSASIGIFEYLDGTYISKGEVLAEHIDEAIFFIKSINLYRNDNDAKDIPNAAESCFSINDHLLLIDRRVNRLLNIDPIDTKTDEALLFVTKLLIPKWNKLKEEAIKNCQKLSIDTNKDINQEFKCLSPSDFGFHNACIVNENIKFFDFEYSGWDDPAKLVCDFFYQPKVPVLHYFLDVFIAGISDALGVPKEPFYSTVKVLIPLYGIKWCSILLNDFLALDNSRRIFSGQEDTTKRRTIQLEKARNLLSSL